MGTIKQRSSGIAANATSSSRSIGNDNKPTIQPSVDNDNDKEQKRRSSSSIINYIIILLMIFSFLGIGTILFSNNFGSNNATIVSSRNMLRRWYTNTPHHHHHHDENDAKSVTLSHDTNTNIHITFHDAQFDNSSSQSSTTTPSRIVSPGPHTMKLTTTTCDDGSRHTTRWAVRVDGDVLLSVPLYETTKNNNLSTTTTTTDYVGTFSLPISGTFTLKIYRSGTNDDDCRTTTTNDASPTTVVIGTISFTVIDNPEPQQQPQSRPGPYLWNRDSLFAPAHWLSIDVIKHRYPDTTVTPSPNGRYIFTNPHSPTAPHPISTTTIPIVKEGTLHQNNNNNNDNNTSGDGFYSFNELSNYELVCFFGGKNTASATWGALRSLRPALFPHQRPFKFHLYESNNITHPNEMWDEETERRLRKCKHLLVFTDDWEYDGGGGGEQQKGGASSLSGEEYKMIMMTFVGHLLKVLPDDTFPIWVFTMMESPLTPSHCHGGGGGSDDDAKAAGPKRSTEHPCNEILRELFAVNNDGSRYNNASSSFPERVRLADNTDLSTARLLLGDDDILEGNNGIDNNDGSTTSATTTSDLDAKARREIVIFNIALRIFVMVGKQVEVWRSNGQIGKVEGLLRHGVKQDEHELVPYKWN